MSKKPTGGIIWRRGKLYARVRMPSGRRAIALPTCETEEEALVRKELIVTAIASLTEVHLEDHIEAIVRRIAIAPTEHLPRTRAYVDAMVRGGAAAAASPLPAGSETTFGKFAEQWTSGELHKLFPDYVKKKSSAPGDLGRLAKHVFPVLKDKPIAAITLDDALEVMRRIPDSSSSATRRHVAQLMNRVFNIAVYPARILDRSPLPKGFLPKVLADKAFTYLYPEEDAQLLGCRTVPIARRMLYGFLAREGMRSSEAQLLAWSDVDLVRGLVNLDRNKTRDPRAWALDKDVAEALRIWHRMHPKATYVFVGEDSERLDEDRLAEQLRADLETAKVERPELFARTEARRPVRIHDLRATFVTLSLAVGRSETWVADRTGHRSSQMINKYRRVSRTAAELGVGWLTSLVQAVPELRENRIRAPRPANTGTAAAPASGGSSMHLQIQSETVGPVGIGPTTNGLKVFVGEGGQTNKDEESSDRGGSEVRLGSPHSDRGTRSVPDQERELIAAADRDRARVEEVRQGVALAMQNGGEDAAARRARLEGLLFRWSDEVDGGES